MYWKDKVVLLTGASSGIGEGIALAIAKQGAILGLLARREDLLNQLAEKCRSGGAAAACVFACDVTNAEAVQQAANALRDEFGHIDVLIANAGIGGSDAETQRFEPDAIRKIIDVNLLGAVNALYAVLQPMIERGSGHLVAISSLAGVRGLPKSAAYSASKAGMTAFFESVRLDVQRKGVFVTIIQPGFIKTPLTKGRENKMPFLMELDGAIPYFLDAIEKKKKFAAFPLPLASLVRLGKIMPAWLYDRIASRANYRR